MYFEKTFPSSGSVFNSKVAWASDASSWQTQGLGSQAAATGENRWWALRVFRSVDPR